MLARRSGLGSFVLEGLDFELLVQDEPTLDAVVQSLKQDIAAKLAVRESTVELALAQGSIHVSATAELPDGAPKPTSEELLSGLVDALNQVPGIEDIASGGIHVSAGSSSTPTSQGPATTASPSSSTPLATVEAMTTEISQATTKPAVSTQAVTTQPAVTAKPASFLESTTSGSSADVPDVEVYMTLTGLSYEKLSEDEDLMQSVKEGICSGIAASVKEGVTPDSVDVTVTAGSVAVHGSVHLPKDADKSKVDEALTEPKKLESAIVQDRLEKLPGILSVMEGPMSLSLGHGSADTANIDVEESGSGSGVPGIVYWLLPLLVLCGFGVFFFFRSRRLKEGQSPRALRREYEPLNNNSNNEDVISSANNHIGELLVDAVIVPGGGLSRDGTPQPWTQERLRRAKVLYNRAARGEHVKRPVIITLSAGNHSRQQGTGSASATEAEVNARYLVRSLGLPADGVLQETLSLDTIGNAYFVRTSHTDPAKLRNLTVVTNEFHMARARAIFDKVFALPPLPFQEGGYKLTFDAVPDTGVSQQALSSRRQSEAESLDSFKRVAKDWENMQHLHNFLFSQHGCYVPRLDSNQSALANGAEGHPGRLPQKLMVEGAAIEGANGVFELNFGSPDYGKSSMKAYYWVKTGSRHTTIWWDASDNAGWALYVDGKAGYLEGGVGAVPLAFRRAGDGAGSLPLPTIKTVAAIEDQPEE